MGPSQAKFWNKKKKFTMKTTDFVLDNRIRRRISLTQESFPNRYKYQPVISQAIYHREAWENAFGHNAENIWLLTLKHQGHFYIATLHDGDPFRSELEIQEAFYPNTTIGNAGSNGCGGMLSPLLLVRKISNYNHMIISKSDAGVWMWESKINPDRSIQASRVPEALISDFRNRLGILWDYINVGYISRYDPEIINSQGKEVAFQTLRSMILAKDLCPDFLNDSKNVHVYHNAIITNKEKLNDSVKSSKYYEAVPALGKTEFDNIFSENTYRFDSEGCKIQTNNGSVTFNARAYITIYPGLVYATKNRISHIGINGSKKGAIVNNAMRPDVNTFLTWNFQSDPTMMRLNRSPMFAGKCLDKAASVLNIGFGDGIQEFDEIPNIEILNSSIEAFLNTNIGRKDNLKIRPYARLEVFVDQITAVEENGENCSLDNISQSDLRNMFGNVDEMFMSVDGQHSVQCVVEILNRIVENPTNKTQLENLRKICSKLWINDYNQLVDLPMTTKFKKNYLNLISLDEGKNISKIAPGAFVEGILVHADTNVPVNPSWSFSPYGNSKNRLVNITDNQWMLRASDYYVQNDEGEYKKVEVAEWMEERNFQKTIPSYNIMFLHEGSGRVYLLNTDVDLPSRVKRDVSPSRNSSSKQNGSSHRSTNMFRSMEPPYRYVAITNGNVELNANNHRIVTLFRKIPSAKAFQERLWEILDQETRNAKQKIQGIRFTAITDEMSIVEKEWNGDLEAYIYNQIIAPFIENKSVEAQFQKHLDIIQKFQDQ